MSEYHFLPMGKPTVLVGQVAKQTLLSDKRERAASSTLELPLQQQN